MAQTKISKSVSFSPANKIPVDLSSSYKLVYVKGSCFFVV